MVAIKQLQKGETLIKEGEQSNEMFWLQKGSMRLFKKKGEGFIELGVIKSGELVGEMSFLDNDPRSASVEALEESELIAIPRGKFEEVMASQPSWLNSLVQTLVKRLRTTNNKLREIENASTVFVQTEDGETRKQHDFISNNDMLRLCSALVLAAVRKGKKSQDYSTKISMPVLQVFGSNIMRIAPAKLSAFIDIMAEAGVLRTEKEEDGHFIYLASVEFVESFMYWAYDDHQKPVEKQTRLSQAALLICDYIYQYGNLAQYGEQAEAQINLAALFKEVVQATGKNHPFNIAAFKEVVDVGLGTEVRVKSQDEQFTDLNLTKFLEVYPYLNLRQRFLDLNEIKRSGPVKA